MPISPGISLGFQMPKIQPVQQPDEMDIATKALGLQAAKAKLAQAGKPKQYEDFKSVAEDISESSQFLMDKHQANLASGMTEEESRAALNPVYQQHAQWMISKGANPKAFRQEFDPKYTSEILSARQRRMVEQEKGTSTMQELEAAGFKRGTPEYQEQLRRKLGEEKSKKYQFRNVGGRVVALDPSNPTAAPIDIGKADSSAISEVVNAFLTGETKGARDKAKNEFAEKWIGTKKFVRDADSLISMVEENPAMATLAGDMASGIDSAFSAAVGLKDMIKIKEGSKFSSDMKDYDFGDITEMAGASSEKQARIFSLAYALATAKGQTGKAVSDNDIKRFVQMIAGAGNSPTQLVRTLSRARDEIVTDFNDQIEVSKLKGVLPEGKEAEFKVEPTRRPKVDQELQELPSDVKMEDGVYEDAGGNRFEVVGGKYRKL